jgi:transcriptional regulator with XRE-family HTH domain
MAPEQSRAARAWLGWSQEELARRSNVSVNTVRNFERGQKSLHSNSVAAMRQAIEAAGIRLLFENTGTAAGIRRQDANPNQSGDAPT